MTGHLGEGDKARMARGRGGGTLTASDGLALLDLALNRDEAVQIPVRLDVPGLRARAARTGADGVPALLRGLLKGPAHPATPVTSENLGGLPRPPPPAEPQETPETPTPAPPTPQPRCGSNFRRTAPGRTRPHAARPRPG